jgi:hypothetical protein
MANQPILKTPLELELEKINLLRIEQHHAITPLYYLLKILKQIVSSQPNLAGCSIFHALYKHLRREEEG